MLSDRIVIKITQKPGESFIDRMIALVEGASRQKTPNEIALNILLASLTIIFLLAVTTLQPLAIFSKVNQPGLPDTSALGANGVTGIVLISLLVCLIPTTIGALLSAIGIAGMDRLVQRNVLAMSGRASKRPGMSTRCCSTRPARSRWGTGRRPSSSPSAPSTERSWLTRHSSHRCRMRRPRAEHRGPCQGGIRAARTAPGRVEHATFVPFSAATRMSGVDLSANGSPARQIRKGAAGSVTNWVREQGGEVPAETGEIVDGISAAGGTPLVVAEPAKASPASSASSTSRTSSSRACASGSTSSAPWASAR